MFPAAVTLLIPEAEADGTLSISPCGPVAGIDDWLSLVDPDGAFLTATELRACFLTASIPCRRPALRTASPCRRSRRRPRGSFVVAAMVAHTVLEWDDGLAEDQRLPGTSWSEPPSAVSDPSLQALLDVDDPNLIRVGVFVWPLGPGSSADRHHLPATPGRPALSTGRDLVS